MWYFLGFLGELGILISAIGIYEFKKRSSEKVYAENQRTVRGTVTVTLMGTGAVTLMGTITVRERLCNGV